VSGRPSFFAELKRRNVYKVAIAYAVIAWLLIQIATQIFPFFGIPNWAVRLVVLLLILCFPVTLMLAWAYELTPQGVKRTEQVVPNESIRRSTGRKLDLFIIGILLVVVGLLVTDRFRRRALFESGVSNKSIAVLPFENLSEDKASAYFADGIQEEILTRLSKIADLKVISRTSTQRFKSSPDNLPQIAKQLGVANVLQGSVQKAADQVRVNVQLINATTDAHLWAESYDRKLTDIFTVESDIARTIADTLKARLTGAEEQAIARRPTEVPEAYEFYLKGRFFWDKRTAADLQMAIQYFNQAIAKDPKYALAYAGLADAYVLLPQYGVASATDSFPQAERAAKKALELDDTLAEAHTSFGRILFFHDLDFGGSTREFERAIALNPNYATAHHWYGVGPLMSLGEFDRAIAELKRAQQLDPLSLIINTDLGAVFFTARRYDDAIAQLRKTIEMDPRFYYAHWNLGEALELKGHLREAFAEYKKAAELNDDPLVLGLMAQAYAKLGQRDEALKMLDQLQQLATRRYVANYIFALVDIALGEKDKAIEWLERAYRDRTGPDISSLKVDPMLDPLRGEPRFGQLVAKVVGPAKTVKP
jgi:TolB-like protein/Tfp pilus assembly protein PilF